VRTEARRLNPNLSGVADEFFCYRRAEITSDAEVAIALVRRDDSVVIISIHDLRDEDTRMMRPMIGVGPSSCLRKNQVCVYELHDRRAQGVQRMISSSRSAERDQAMCRVWRSVYHTHSDQMIQGFLAIFGSKFPESLDMYPRRKLC
jgi:hypothetical protein